jgi:hypothetical protein
MNYGKTQLGVFFVSMAEVLRAVKTDHGVVKGGPHMVQLREAVALGGIRGIVSPSIASVVWPQGATGVRQRRHSRCVMPPLQSSRSRRCRGVEVGCLDRYTSFRPTALTYSSVHPPPTFHTAAGVCGKREMPPSSFSSVHELKGRQGQNTGPNDVCAVVTVRGRTEILAGGAPIGVDAFWGGTQ